MRGQVAFGWDDNAANLRQATPIPAVKKIEVLSYFMNSAGRVTPGEERICPHCRGTILRSASVCPICEHSLRYDSPGIRRDRPAVVSAFNVEGTIHHPDVGEQWEYSMVLSIRNDRGEEITRKMVGVGALSPNESRTFTVAVAISKQTDPNRAKVR